MKLRYRFFIRNHWSDHFDGFYLIGLGYKFQGPQLVCWQLHLLGICFCFFVDGEKANLTPFPGNFSFWWRKKYYRWKHRNEE